MVFCCIVGCSNTYKSGNNRRFYRLPKVIRKQCDKTLTLSDQRRRLWISRINRKKLNLEYARVCDKHFLSGQPAGLFDDTSVDWAPSLQLGYDCKLNTDVEHQRHNRSMKRRKVLSDMTNTNSTLLPPVPVEQDHLLTSPSEVIFPDEVEMVVDEVIDNTNDNYGDHYLAALGNSDSVINNEFNQDLSYESVSEELVNTSLQHDNNYNTSCHSENIIYVPVVSVEENEGLVYYECLNHLATENKVKQTFCDSSTQTDMEGAFLYQLETDNRYLREEIVELKKKIVKHADVCEEKLKQPGNEKLVKFYTGISNFSLLFRIFTFIQVALPPQSEKNCLSHFQEFLLVLMRLRLNVPLQDLAYRFGISQSTASRIFKKWIDVMHIRLRPVIRWPDREDLWNAMPNSFKRIFGNKVAVIIDCFEVFIIRPSALLARAVTFSNYKHHNTVKYLIGITPAGTISFLSDGYGGRCSDKFITEDCGFLDNILPGDAVMADRGFNIADTLGNTNSSLLVPTFTKGKNQLEMVETEETRKISNLRIHVERVIGLVRSKFTILSGTLPVECLVSEEGESPMIDKIATVCCALTNFCPSIVSQE